MTIADVVIIGLASWRLSAMLSYEDGPYGIFDRLREWLWPPGGPDMEGVRAEVSGALACVWCLSPWAAAATWLLWLVSPVIPAIMAAAAVVVIVERWVRPPAGGTDGPV